MKCLIYSFPLVRKNKDHKTMSTTKKLRKKRVKLPKAADLAVEFSKVLRQWLTPKQMDDVVKANLVEGVNGHRNVCHTHDHCDANEAMAEAFRNLTGTAVDTSDDEQTALFNEAWSMAKAADFHPPKDNRPLWAREHGAHAGVPALVDVLVDCGVLCDTSYHNDICPSFALNDGNGGDQMQLWVDYSSPADREMPEWPRFRVCSGHGSTDDHQTYHESDDLMAALTELFRRAGPSSPTALSMMSNLWRRAYEVMAERFGDLGDVSPENDLAIETAKRLDAEARRARNAIAQKEVKKA